MKSPTQESVDAASYPESQLQWLISLLNLLAGIVNRNEDLSCVVVTEIEYQQLSAVLDDLIYGVGDDENHPLSAAMTLVGSLIKAYQDEHFPKLGELFPELAEETSSTCEKDYPTEKRKIYEHKPRKTSCQRS